MPQIEVTFDIDANGILNVSAKDKATGKEQSIVIKASSGLSDAEIDKMVKDAEANAEVDRKFAETVTARNTLEGLIHATQKTLKEAGDKATAEEKSSIEAAIKEAESVVKGEDIGKIEAATTKLTEVSGSLAQKLYAEQQAAGAQGAGAADAGDSGKAADDGAVDAEFEEVKENK
jgi:molecular chaperone DnaK